MEIPKQCIKYVVVMSRRCREKQIRSNYERWSRDQNTSLYWNIYLAVNKNSNWKGSYIKPLSFNSFTIILDWAQIGQSFTCSTCHCKFTAWGMNCLYSSKISNLEDISNIFKAFFQWKMKSLSNFHVKQWRVWQI